MTPEDFAVLYSKFSEEVYLELLGITKDQTIASDLMQEVFVNIWAHREHFTLSEVAPQIYISKVTRNIASEYLKAKKTIPPNSKYTFKKQLHNRNKEITDETIENGEGKNSDKDLKLYFNLDGFSSNEISEILSLLNLIYQSIGGDGLEIKKMNTLDFSNILMPA